MTTPHETAVAVVDDLLTALRLDFLEASRRVRATTKNEKERYRRIYNNLRDELIEAETVQHALRLRKLPSSAALETIKGTTKDLVQQSKKLDQYAQNVKDWRKRIKEFSTIIDTLIPLFKL